MCYHLPQNCKKITALFLSAPLGSAQEIPNSLKFVLFVGNMDTRSATVKHEALDKIVEYFLLLSCFYTAILLVAALDTFMKMTGGQWTIRTQSIQTPPSLSPTKSNSNAIRLA